MRLIHVFNREKKPSLHSIALLKSSFSDAQPAAPSENKDAKWEIGGVGASGEQQRVGDSIQLFVNLEL